MTVTQRMVRLRIVRRIVIVIEITVIEMKKIE